MTPQRIQLSRRRGWRLQEASRALNGLEAVNVARPSRWGNPFYGICVEIGTVHFTRHSALGGTAERMFLNFRALDKIMERAAERAVAMTLFHVATAMFQIEEPERFEGWIAPLRGKNLACWCPLDHPCHADVLLRLANETEGKTDEAHQ